MFKIITILCVWRGINCALIKLSGSIWNQWVNLNLISQHLKHHEKQSFNITDLSIIFIKPVIILIQSERSPRQVCVSADPQG